MKLFQLILILLILCTSYPVNASRDTNSYDGNIFPIYAGNGAIVPPQTTLEESLKNRRVSVLFFYLDDSSDSKAMAPIILFKSSILIIPFISNLTFPLLSKIIV